MKTGIEILIRYKDGAINDATKIIPCRIKIDRHNSWSEIVELLTKHDYPISITGDDVEMVDILSNLAYGITGEEEALDVLAVEKQIQALDEEMDRTVVLQQKSGSNQQKYRDMISEICRQMAALRGQLELIRAKIAANENLSLEMERLKQIFTSKQVAFDEYDEVTVRLLIEYIRVMADGKIIIVLKGGVQIEEELRAD